MATAAALASSSASFQQHQQLQDAHQTAPINPLQHQPQSQAPSQRQPHQVHHHTAQHQPQPPHASTTTTATNQQQQHQNRPVPPSLPYYSPMEQAQAILSNPLVTGSLFNHVFNICLQGGIRPETHLNYHHPPQHYHPHLHSAHHHRHPDSNCMAIAAALASASFQQHQQLQDAHQTNAPINRLQQQPLQQAPPQQQQQTPLQPAAQQQASNNATVASCHLGSPSQLQDPPQVSSELIQSAHLHQQQPQPTLSQLAPEQQQPSSQLTDNSQSGNNNLTNNPAAATTTTGQNQASRPDQHLQQPVTTNFNPTSIAAHSLPLQHLLTGRHPETNCMALAAALASASFQQHQQLQQAHQNAPINQLQSQQQRPQFPPQPQQQAAVSGQQTLAPPPPPPLQLPPQTQTQQQPQQSSQPQGPQQPQQSAQQQQQPTRPIGQPTLPPFYSPMEQAYALLSNSLTGSLFNHVFNIYMQNSIRPEPHHHPHHHHPQHYHHHLHNSHHNHHHGPNGQNNGQDDTMLTMGESKPRGLNRAEIDSLTPYIQIDEKDSRLCVICLSKFELKSKIRPLPCTHAFHAKCVDKWLRANRTCPICRRDALKTYVSKIKRI